MKEGAQGYFFYYIGPNEAVPGETGTKSTLLIHNYLNKHIDNMLIIIVYDYNITIKFKKSY